MRRLRGEQLRRAARRFRRLTDEASEREETPWAGFETPSGVSFGDVLQSAPKGGLEELLNDYDVSRVMSSLYRVTKRFPPMVSLDTDRSKRQISAELELLFGVGPVTRQLLRERGVSDIESARGHPRFGPEAERVWRHLENGNVESLHRLACIRRGAASPVANHTAALHDPGLAFLDIETLGFFGRAVFLVGVGFEESEGFVVEQFFASDLSAEVEAVTLALEQVGERRALVSFNGRSFDAPLLDDRLLYYGRTPGFQRQLHYDMLHLARRSLDRETLPNLRLVTLEQRLFNHRREQDVPSHLVPQCYEHYLRTGEAGPVSLVIRHNSRDIVTTAMLLTKLLYDL